MTQRVMRWNDVLGKHALSLSRGPAYHSTRDRPPLAPGEVCWIINTKGNNGLVVGPKGSNANRVQNNSGARVHCESDRTTVMIVGLPDAVKRARALVEEVRPGQSEP